MDNIKRKGKAESVKPKRMRRGKVLKATAICLVLGLFASAIVGLSVALYYSDNSLRAHEMYQRQMDAVYSRAYFDLVDGASTLGINLRKIGISNSPSMQQSLLLDVWNVASLAENDLAVFDGRDEGLLKAQKFVNQLGDFSHTLAKKVASGQSLSMEDRETLMKLGDMADVYMDALGRIKVGDDGSFVGDGGALEGLKDAFSQFSDPSLCYPEMIYDGPFSDALETRVPALGGEEIGVDEGEKLIEKYFDGYALSSVRFAGEGCGNICTLDFDLTIDGKNAYAQIGKFGGRLVAFDMAASGNGDAETADCAEAAIKFAKSLGLNNMSLVWASDADGVCTFNLAPMQDGVVLYPDLVKVKVAGGKVVGYDAAHYVLNHKERKIGVPAISEETAREKLSIAPACGGVLALIPLKSEREVLTYEFECADDGTYFVYVDAMSGEEVNILYVVDDGAGVRTM